MLVDFGERVRMVRFRFGSAGFAPTGPAQLGFSAAGTVGGSSGRILGALGLLWQSNKVALSLQTGSLPLESPFRLEFYEGAQPTGGADFQTDGSIGNLTGETRIASLTIGQADVSRSRWSLYDVEFTGRVQISTAQGMFNGTRLRILTLNAAGGLQNLETVGVSGRNIPAMMITQEEAPLFQPQLMLEPSREDHVLR